MEAYLVTDRRVVAPEYFSRFLSLAAERREWIGSRSERRTWMAGNCST